MLHSELIPAAESRPVGTRRLMVMLHGWVTAGRLALVPGGDEPARG